MTCKITILTETMKEPETIVGKNWDDCVDQMFETGILQMVQSNCDCEPCDAPCSDPDCLGEAEQNEVQLLEEYEDVSNDPTLEIE